MRLHLNLLAWLYVIWGCFGVLVGLSLGVLALGTSWSVSDLPRTTMSGTATVWVFVIFGLGFAGGGLLAVLVGRAVLQRRRGGRPAALALAVPNLLLVPFGTALAVYTFWALLNNDARRAFGGASLTGRIESET